MTSIEESKSSGRAGEPPAGTLAEGAGADDAAPKSTLKQEINSFFKNLAFLAVAFCFLKGTIIEAFKIPSGSMIPTLRIGDHLLVCKFSYGLRILGKRDVLFQYSQPTRGDIVVFTRDDEPGTPEDESDPNIIKRVMGLPGDTVEVRGTKLYINNEEQQEDYARWSQGGIPEGNFGPEVVPEGRVFLLGDNRDQSKDSRFWLNPFLDMRDIKGRALIIYWSWHDWHRIGTLIR